MSTVHFPMKPMPAPRPRFGKGHTYNSEKYTAWKRDVRNLWTHDMLTVPAEIHVRIFEWKNNTDGDNCLKAIQDSLSGVAYQDDCLQWLRAASIRCVYGTGKEGFEVTVRPWRNEEV